ncbi:helix-turn-helix domain-containing protein [Achromobacter sp. UMC46]|uniref:helix-turn-helix domain-containing protein n=1 Tax=Achromobacter sp. UMC46 TaxID=1862319 RepID=UPI001602D4C6|nr:helix-turn-helix domain-containing protein [Achromobacter sp. UMC46]MBB1593159.1 AraC family transcriptional regulator [Achromobacter sp. UMC46]
MLFQPTYMRHVYTGLEPSQAFDIVYGGTFEHRLLSSKLATMEHQRLNLGNLRLETGCYDFPVVAQGSMPKEAVCIGFMAAGGHVTRYNTSLIGDEDIQIYPPGADLLYHASGSSRWVNFTVPEDQLQQAAFVRNGRPLEILKNAAYSVRLRAGERRALTVLADDAMAVARRLENSGGMAPDLVSVMGDSMLTRYVDVLRDAEPTAKPKASSASQRHHYLVSACERLAISGASSEITLVEIARRSGYTLRSLELIFRRSVGMTPGRWFMNARLNGALRDLIACSAERTISDIAIKWGFRHLSRFSQYYRQAFGELPSDTLKRGRSGILGTSPCDGIRFKD